MLKNRFSKNKLSISFIFIILIIHGFKCTYLNSNDSPPGQLFVLVHYSNPVNNISNENLKKILNGKIKNFSKLGGENRSIGLCINKSISDHFKKKFPDIKIKPVSFNSKKIFSNKKFMGICSIKELSPKFKALYIDNKLPWGELNKDYTLSKIKSYPFKLPGIEQFDSNKIFTVVQTGVTAMTRAFIKVVEKSNDIFIPVKHTKNITKQADLAMTSNEVSFLNPCTYPFRNNLSFCSPKKYFKILRESGFDIIELTGNHNNDYGYRYNTDSMNMITDSGMIYFGGGKNLKDANKIRYKTINNIKIAFVGFNEIGPSLAWAKKNKPGALKLSLMLFKKLIKTAVANADIVFLTVQWCNENNPAPWKKQIKYFHLAADLGATVIVSSSSHRAMGVEFYKDKFISYGLGNFLFDQMHTINHRRGLIARHIFYKSRHLQTELIPYLIYNHSQPKPVHGTDAKKLFRYIFKYSRGEVFK